MAVCLGAGSQMTVRRRGDPPSCLRGAVSHMTGAHISWACCSPSDVQLFGPLQVGQVQKPSECGRNLAGLSRRGADNASLGTRGEHSQISQMQFPVLRPGWDDGDFGSNFSPDTRAIPLCRTASTEVSADRPETSVAACPWSSPA